MNWLESLTPWISASMLLMSGALVLGIGGFSLLSLREGEQQAAGRAAGIAVLAGLIYLIGAVLPPAIQLFLLVLTLLVLLAGAALLLLPERQDGMTHQNPTSRYDERDIPFARIRLVPESPQYRSYYQMRPERLAFDDRLRRKPGLLSPHAKLADPLLFAAADGSFFLTEALAGAVDGRISPERINIPPAEMSAYIKSLTRHYGALQVGITDLRPYHVYSHIGRGQGVYGDPIPVEGQWAIAFTVEMDFGLTGSGPHPPAVMESAHQYVEAARTAVQLAAAIRLMGYPARAHIDGNYRVICPLVARDAGLGEIGRIGLLMSPGLGPRVRLGVVTTELELVADPPQPSPTMIDFCSLCEKCATCCPPQAIPFGPQEETGGTSRWRIDADKCFGYWNQIGTDCARCMAVCPFSHPDTAYHNLIRRGIRRSHTFRHLALKLDDFFYGAKPPSRKPPKWTVHTPG